MMKKGRLFLLSLTLFTMSITGCDNHTVEHVHSWSDVTYTWSNDYSICTATRVCTLDGRHKESETVSSTYVVINEVKCETNGSARYIATFSTNGFVTQTHDVALTAHDHNYQFDSFVWEEDFTAKAKYVCSYDDTHVTYFGATVTSKVTTEATYDNDGVRTYTASYDGHKGYMTETIEKLEREWTITYLWNGSYNTGFTCDATATAKDNPSIKEEEQGMITSETIKSATCDESGEISYSAKFNNPLFKDGSTHIEYVSALGHNWGEVEYFSYRKGELTASRDCLNDNKHSEDETVQGVYEVKSYPAKEQPGLGRYTYTFTNPAFDTQVEDVVLPYGSFPVLSEDGTHIIYGLYPQTHVTDETIISALNDMFPTCNHWYLYNGEYYYAEYTRTYRDTEDYTFNNGDTIKNNKSYWYKCEPISWKILSSNNNEYFVVSDLLLDTQKYSVINNNNYENSSIRSWLNETFLDRTFYFDSSSIKLTEVDNTASTTGNVNNPYACDITEDFIFLLSYQDYINTAYGFSNSTSGSETRMCLTTDYTRAMGAALGNGGYGNYWTRSPNSGNKNYAMHVRTDGTIHYDNNTSYSFMCVRPAMYITITQS